MQDEHSKRIPVSNAPGLMPRPPVVVVMGHVDHGKTTLLDYVRKANVAEREAGGITQTVGAYEIVHAGKKITFIDTPGHKAFTSMRTRGAHVADLAILVVAADEGVRPQTEEVITIIKASETPFVVAMTKIDKPNANIEKVKNDLLAAGVLLEGYGGDISYEPISAKSGVGVDKLLDLILLAAELENLTYDPGTRASGYVLEVQQNPKRGAEAVVIVKNGTLRRGGTIHTPSAQGKVRMLDDFLGKPASELSPSSPAIIVGFETLPQIGEEFFEGEGTSHAEAVPGARVIASRTEGESTLNLVLKAGDAGSLEALHQVVAGLPVKDTKIMVVGQSVGDITEADVKLAVATGAVIAGFAVKADKSAKNLSDGQHITIITSPIIYKIVEMIEETLTGGLQKFSGSLDVLALFNQKKLSEQLVGGALTEGILKAKIAVEIFRGGKPVGTGRIINLREKKSDITEAVAPKEIGLIVNSEMKIEIGDRIVAKA